ncbi:MAG: imidazole glycerol phosphate synthase subunit HisH [Flavipsychrobacter sp.]|nr:imidazole glycerol phosphate synthase subunit HisH [Flavipsychrobacter sp.]
MKVVIVQYNAGNTCSVDFALQRIGIQAVISDNADEIRSADKVIFPGVGAAAPAMAYLADKNLVNVIKKLTQPVLGICLGMQLMCSWSEEGDTQCLGIFDQQVKRFAETAGKVPHMGWNNIYGLQSNLFKELEESTYMYYVHSYYAEKGAHTIATTNYGIEYSGALNKDNFYGVQFHPEKSAKDGQKILENFINL